MTSTSSPARRVALRGTAVIALLLLGVNVAVYLALRAGLLDSLGDLVVLQALGSTLAVGLGAVLLVRAAREPLQQVVDRAERRTGVLEVRWRQVLEVAQEAYVAIDAEGRVVDWNRRAETLFGWSREAALGMPATALIAEQDRDHTPPLFGQAIAALTPHELAAPFDMRAVDRHGRVFLAQCTVWGVERRGGSVVHTFVRDVTARRRTEQTAALLTAVVEGTADAIVTHDLDGTILTWNAGARRIHGWSADEAIGRHVSLAVPADTMPELDAMMEQLRRGERPGEVESERLTRGGTRVPVALRLSPVHDESGAMVAVSAIARDVTEQRWMAETLDSTLAALQTAADEALASAESTRRFLADAAHQLRTPMAGIGACAETLLRGAAPEDADRLLATMVRETSRAARLISALLQMARLDQGLPLATGPVDVEALCADEVERVRLLSPDLDVRFDVRNRPAGRLLLDDQACREVLSNLTDNARRHASGVVAMVLDAGGPDVRIRVDDDGPGVPADARERVFERFVSLDGRGGSGLGLPIARALARAMGGELRYEEGFVLTLPASGA